MPKRRISAEAVVIDDENRVLLIKQGRTRHDWELPGGKVRKGEAIVDALEREVLEETGIEVRAQRLIGLFQILDEAYIDLVFLCRITPHRRHREPRPAPPEISACAFFPIDALPKEIRPFTVDRIADGRKGSSHPLPMLLKSADWLG